jgi:hypothetical protein
MGRKAQPGNEKWWEKNFQKLYQNLPEPDLLISRNPIVKEQIIKKTFEAFRQGIKGVAHDFKLYANPWDFDLKAIPSANKVHIFHGELDRNVPISMAKKISKLIPNCESKFYANEGHLSVFVNKFDEIILMITQ